MGAVLTIDSFASHVYGHRASPSGLARRIGLWPEADAQDNYLNIASTDSPETWYQPRDLVSLTSWVRLVSSETGSSIGARARGGKVDGGHRPPLHESSVYSKLNRAGLSLRSRIYSFNAAAQTTNPHSLVSHSAALVDLGKTGSCKVRGEQARLPRCIQSNGRGRPPFHGTASTARSAVRVPSHPPGYTARDTQSRRTLLVVAPSGHTASSAAPGICLSSPVPRPPNHPRYITS